MSQKENDFDNIVDPESPVDTQDAIDQNNEDEDPIDGAAVESDYENGDSPVETDPAVAVQEDDDDEPDDYIAQTIALLKQNANYDVVYKIESDSDDSAGDDDNDGESGSSSSEDEMCYENSDEDDIVDDGESDSDGDSPRKKSKSKAKSKAAPKTRSLRKRKADETSSIEPKVRKARVPQNTRAKALANESGCVKSFGQIAKFIAKLGFAVMLIKERDSHEDSGVFQMKKGCENSRSKWPIPSQWTAQADDGKEDGLVDYAMSEAVSHFPAEYDTSTSFENPFGCLTMSARAKMLKEIENIRQCSSQHEFDLIFILSGTKETIEDESLCTPRIVIVHKGGVAVTLFQEMLETERTTVCMSDFI